MLVKILEFLIPPRKLNGRIVDNQNGFIRKVYNNVTYECVPKFFDVLKLFESIRWQWRRWWWRRNSQLNKITNFINRTKASKLWNERWISRLFARSDGLRDCITSSHNIVGCITITFSASSRLQDVHQDRRRKIRTSIIEFFNRSYKINLNNMMQYMFSSHFFFFFSVYAHRFWYLLLNYYRDQRGVVTKRVDSCADIPESSRPLAFRF